MRGTVREVLTAKDQRNAVQELLELLDLTQVQLFVHEAHRT